jgi:hypothetical protein
MDVVDQRIICEFKKYKFKKNELVTKNIFSGLNIIFKSCKDNIMIPNIIANMIGITNFCSICPNSKKYYIFGLSINLEREYNYSIFFDKIKDILKLISTICLSERKIIKQKKLKSRVLRSQTARIIRQKKIKSVESTRSQLININLKQTVKAVDNEIKQIFGKISSSFVKLSKSDIDVKEMLRIRENKIIEHLKSIDCIYNNVSNLAETFDSFFFGCFLKVFP